MNGETESPQDEQKDGLNTTTIIIIAGGVFLALALGAIIYCKCKK